MFLFKFVDLIKKAALYIFVIGILIYTGVLISVLILDKIPRTNGIYEYYLISKAQNIIPIIFCLLSALFVVLKKNKTACIFFGMIASFFIFYPLFNSRISYGTYQEAFSFAGIVMRIILISGVVLFIFVVINTRHTFLTDFLCNLMFLLYILVMIVAGIINIYLMYNYHGNILANSFLVNNPTSMPLHLWEILASTIYFVMPVTIYSGYLIMFDNSEKDEFGNARKTSFIKNKNSHINYDYDNDDF